jgi:hypothetical protein
MRNCWNSAKVRQPEVAADHRHTWISSRAAQKTFLHDDLTGDQGQILGGSPPLTAGGLPSTDGVQAPPPFHRVLEDSHPRLLMLDKGEISGVDVTPTYLGRAGKGCLCTFRRLQGPEPVLSHCGGPASSVSATAI